MKKNAIFENRSIDANDYSTSTYDITDTSTIIATSHKDYTALDKIYVLSAQEAYRYYGESVIAASNERNKNGDWWLRSANSF